MKWIQLEPWQELFGTILDITSDENVVIATIAGLQLRYPRRSAEGEFLLKHLKPEKIGRKVGILHCETEFRVWWPDEKPQPKKPSGFWEWYYKTYGLSEEG